jgi:hypothetical protein
MRRELKMFIPGILLLVLLACNLPTMIPATGAPTPTGPVSLGTITIPALTGTPAAGSTQPVTEATPGGQGATCTYKAVFVDDVTIPDNSVIPAGQAFVKTWRVRNEGTCIWGPTGHNLHALAFTSGEQMGAPVEVPLPAEVRPGDTVDVSVTMQAPTAAGRYTSNWLFRVDGDPAGVNWVGVGDKRSDPLFVIIRVEDRD